MKQPKPKIIDTMVWKGSQSWNYKRLIDLGGHRVKIFFKRDSYDFQCEAHADRWDGAKWHRVYSLPFSNTLFPGRVSAHQPKAATALDFESDYEKLVKLVGDIILSPVPA